MDVLNSESRRQYPRTRPLEMPKELVFKEYVQTMAFPTAESRGSNTKGNRQGDSAKSIVILGGGITGLTAAWELSRQTKNPILLIEKNRVTGGLANSFSEIGLKFDLGSHRIHEKYDPEVFSIIKSLLGDDLLKRPRRGQIRIGNTFLDYPPSMFQVLTGFGPRAGLSIFTDYLIAAIRRTAVRKRSPASFEEYAIDAVGRSLYEKFYRPYALKLWGISPSKLSPEPGVSRVVKFSRRAMWEELKRGIHVSGGSKYFYYPADGFGQISEKIKEKYLQNGGKLLVDTVVQNVEINDDFEIEAVHVQMPCGGSRRIPAKLVISTAPIDVLHNLVRFRSDNHVPPPLELRWRSLRILYLASSEVISTGHETYYFPGSDVLFGRVSEPAMYSPRLNAAGHRRALAIELPCTYEDEIWQMSDGELAARCIDTLRKQRILRENPHGQFEYFSRRIKNLYPVYEIGWKEKLETAMARFNSIGNLYMIGRPALFLHCNLDHCMVMALRLARYLMSESQDRAEWEKGRSTFSNFALHD
jgi:protoporphyrinogen oxidase